MWTLVDGVPFCPEHGKSFGSTEVCPECPTRVTVVESNDAAPDDPQAHADEAWCREQRDRLVDLAIRMAEQRDEREAIDRVGYSTVAKLYDTALKFHRAAVEECHRRGDRQHEIWLVEQHRRLKERAH